MLDKTVEKEANEEPITRRTVLIVEDNELNREMLKGILEEHYAVIEAEDGVVGLEKLNRHYRALSLVLLDVQMPRMNGYEFLERYRADPLLASVPVIVTTGSTISEDEERCLALGASDFVSKPYNPRVILRRIEAIIRLHESIATLRAVEFDALTGLHTKASFCHHAQTHLQRENARHDLLMINVEGFSYINERYGQATGDELLRHLGARLRKYAKDSILSCRYQADRFVLMRNHTEQEDRDALLETFDRHLRENAPVSDFTLKYAAYDNVDPAVPVPVLCDRLSLAMETIRRQYNQKIAVFVPSMSEKINRLHRIEACMKDALAQNQFKVFYQPKHDAKTGKIVGAEALVRWIHPELGFISPGDFIPLFEQNGFITDLDLYVLRTVCRDLRAWHEAGISPVPVSVNLSRRDFLTLDDEAHLTDPLNEHKIDKRYLHFEITESLCVDDETVLEKVRSVRELGFSIELDDFGSGQSSLGTIGDIPMDVIKLDISFARALQKRIEIVRMIISLAHALGLRTVAEGVETEEQLVILREMGCDVIQGFFFSKPLPEPDFRHYLSSVEHAEKEVLFA